MNEMRAALLTVGLEEEDRQTLTHAANGFDCDVIGARTIQEVIRFVRGRGALVIVCARDFSDGGWRDVVDLFAVRKSGAKIIVVSRLADNRLWSEVLNLGGYDVLASPLDEHDASRVLDWACHGSYGVESSRQEELVARCPACNGEQSDLD